MQFSSVIGQQTVKDQLLQMLRQNRLSHALLFLGKEGSGSLSLALAFAQYLVCEKVNGKQTQPTSTSPALFADETIVAETTTFLPDSCGECAACIKAAKMIHPDIHYSFPVITKKAGESPISNDFIKEWREFILAHPYGNLYDWLQHIGAENKQGNITARECNEMIHKMSLKSFEAPYKIMILWMPELLGKEGNKLLKLIEEPAPDTLFILVAENEALILPTILSRTQLVRVPRLTRAEIEQALQQQSQPPQKAAQIAATSEGNFHEALQQMEHDEDDWEGMLRNWLNTIIKTGPAEQVKWIETAAKLGREKQKQFLKFFIQLLQVAIRLRIMGDTEEARATAPGSMSDFALRLNKFSDITQQEAIISELDAASYYIERNANAKMLFHALTIRLYHIISNKSVILVN
ncbi:MAG TPA: hypothetical protein PK872_03410 [Ferruginibacter sp.]|nr:hypothetical protein [Ferruginibacter sp.]